MQHLTEMCPLLIKQDVPFSPSIKILAPFLDDEGRLTQYPAKRQKQLAALKYLAAKLQRGRDFSEAEMNERLNELHTFGDHCLLRRDMCDAGLLRRDKGGKNYRVAENEE